MEDTLVVYDFDWSLINQNSDTYVVEQLAPQLVESFNARAKEEYLGKWTQLMHTVMQEMYELGIKASQVQECLRGIPVFEASSHHHNSFDFN